MSRSFWNQIYLTYASMFKIFVVNFVSCPALIQAVFHVVDAFGREKIGAQKLKKQIFFHDKFYPSKAHVYYFTVLIYLATWRAAKLGIFTHFMFTNLPWCSQSINSLIYVYSIQIPSCFLWVLDPSCNRTSSSYYLCPKKFSKKFLLLKLIIWFIFQYV